MKTKVPNKIRHFIWRAAKDSLPTKLNLMAWYIPIDDVYDGCKDHADSIMHCLWLCDQARAVWLSNLRFSFMVQKNCRSFVELLKVLFWEGSGFRIALFATICWCLWQQINRVREHQPLWQLHEIRERAEELVLAYLEAHK